MGEQTHVASYSKSDRRSPDTNLRTGRCPKHISDHPFDAPFRIAKWLHCSLVSDFTDVARAKSWRTASPPLTNPTCPTNLLQSVARHVGSNIFAVLAEEGRPIG